MNKQATKEAKVKSEESDVIKATETQDEAAEARNEDAANPDQAEANQVRRAAEKRAEASGSKVDSRLEELAVALEVEANTAQNHGIKGVAINLRDIAAELRAMGK